MRKTRNLVETVRCPSTNAHTSEPFSFTRNRALKTILEHETSPPRRFILRPTAADVPPSRFRHSKHFQIPRLPGEVRLPMVFITHLSPGKRSPLVRMPVTDPLCTTAQIRSRST